MYEIYAPLNSYDDLNSRPRLPLFVVAVRPVRVDDFKYVAHGTGQVTAQFYLLTCLLACAEAAAGLRPVSQR